MIIETIELKNFGSHKELKAEIGSNVVGVMGSNGSGKSTILRAIEFALTGGLEDKADSYVHATVGDKPASNADVTLTFSKNGKKGKIMRRVGKSPKRALWWDEREITKAADIDALLKEVFCADKQAISNAIFPGQGALDKLLFGNQAERETLFMRLLLLGHLNTVENVIDGQIQKLNGMMQDFGVLEDDLKKQEEQVQHDIQSMSAELAKIPDYSEHIECLNKTIELAVYATARDNELKELSSVDYELAKSTVYGLQNRLRDLCGTGPDSGYKEFHSVLNDIATDINSKTEEREALLQTKRKCEDIISVQTDINKLTKEKANVEERLASLTAKLDEYKDVDPNILELKRNYIKANQTAQQFKEQHDVLTVKIKTVQQQLEELNAEKVIASIEQTINTLSANLSNCKVKLNIMQAVQGLSACNTDIVNCPICSSEVSADMKEVAIKTSADLQTEITNVSKELASFQTQLVKVRQQQSELSTEHVLTSDKLKQVNQGMADLMVTPDPAALSLEQLEELVARKTDLTQKIIVAKTEISGFEKSIQSAVSKFTTEEWKAFYEGLNKLESVTAALAEVDSQILILSQKLDKIRVALTDYNTQYQTYNNQIAKLNAAKESALKAQLELKQFEDKANMVISYIHAYVNKAECQLNTDSSKVAWVNYLSQCQDQRLIKNGMLQTSMRYAERVAAAKQELEDKKLKQIKLVIAVDELRQLKRTFTRQGLPMSYLNYRFEKLTELTQYNLNLLGSNFIIRADPETPLSFLFKRLDQPDSAELPQFKMSGGQRVRLSIAFLLAVQQLVLPEVSLLVLDEPSLHLDQEAVESLRDLLQNLGSTLASSEAQVIVCDHNPILLPAMSKVVSLSNSNK